MDRVREHGGCRDGRVARRGRCWAGDDSSLGWRWRRWYRVVLLVPAVAFLPALHARRDGILDLARLAVLAPPLELGQHPVLGLAHPVRPDRAHKQERQREVHNSDREVDRQCRSTELLQLGPLCRRARGCRRGREAATELVAGKGRAGLRGRSSSASGAGRGRARSARTRTRLGEVVEACRRTSCANCRGIVGARGAARRASIVVKATVRLVRSEWWAKERGRGNVPGTK